MKRNLRLAILNQLNVAEHGRLPPMLRTAFSSREWEQALQWLDLSGLAVYFHQPIQSSSAPFMLPDFVSEELERRSADNRLRTREILKEFRVLIETLEGSGVNYAVLKGISLLPDY